MQRIWWVSFFNQCNRTIHQNNYDVTTQKNVQKGVAAYIRQTLDYYDHFL